MSSGHVEDYRRAEAALWDAYGLHPQEHVVEAGPSRSKIRVSEVGEGPAVVFIGGTGGTGPYWAPLLAQLGVRALIVDRPGFGLSDPIDFNAEPHRILVTSILEDVLDAVHAEDVGAIVGASIGNVWALTGAEQLGDRVRSVVLLGGGPITQATAPPPFIRLLRSPVGALIVRLPQRPKMLQGQLRQMGHGATLDAGRIPDVFFDWQSALMGSTDSMRHERRMVQSVLRRDGFVADLRFDGARGAAVKQPVLMVIGTNDPVGGVDVWEAFVASLPDGTLHTVADAGHLPWLDDPQDVADAMRAHIRAASEDHR